MCLFTRLELNHSKLRIFIFFGWTNPFRFRFSYQQSDQSEYTFWSWFCWIYKLLILGRSPKCVIQTFAECETSYGSHHKCSWPCCSVTDGWWSGFVLLLSVFCLQPFMQVKRQSDLWFVASRGLLFDLWL